MQPLSPALAAAHAVWTRNTYAERAHKYCTGFAGLNLGSAAFTDVEETRFNTCMAKYAQAFELYTQERDLSAAQDAEMDRLQQNRFHKFA